METIPRDYGERCQFDAFCKLIMSHEALDYLRELQRRRDREMSLDALPQSEQDKLCTFDSYPSDHRIFSAHGYDLLIDNELVANAFAELPAPEQSILILRFVLELTDKEISKLMGMSEAPSSAAGQRR